MSESFIMPEIQLPVFADCSYSVSDYGAIGNGLHLNTVSFARAIDTCAEAGGGTVRIPAGIWLTGAIRLRSNVNLHVEAGALVLFSPDFNDYPLIQSSYEGRDAVRCMSPLYGEKLENIAITGRGVFDGSGDSWRPVKKMKMTAAQWKQLVTSGGVVEENADIWWPTRSAMEGARLAEQLHEQQSVSIKDYTAIRDYLRPNLLFFQNCTRVLIDGPTFQNSPAWCLHPRLCEQVTIRNVTVKNPWFAQNGDGLDLESCKYVVVEDSVFDVGDDAICLKSGKDEEGRRLGKPCEYITIRGCQVYHGHGGFVVGSEMSGGVRNVQVSDCMFMGTDVGIRFKSTRGRGGIVENIDISRIRMKSIAGEAILFSLFYGQNKNNQAASADTAVSEATPHFRNISIRDSACIGARTAMLLQGLPEMPVTGIRLKNVTISAENGVICTDGKELSFHNVQILAKNEPVFTLENCQRVHFDQMENVPAKAVKIKPPNIPLLTAPYYTGVLEPDINQAEALLTWQIENGGWSKNMYEAYKKPWDGEAPKSEWRKGSIDLATIDNDGTVNEMLFLAKMYQETGDIRYRDAVRLAVDLLLEMQYPSGGWPQVSPHRGNYSDYVTFNDDAMIRVMFAFRMLVNQTYPFDSDLVTADQVTQLKIALDKGLEFILKSQIPVNGELTAWCQQHDPVTYEPRPGRSYELPAITANESVGVLEYLMTLPEPTPEVMAAIKGALNWLEQAAVKGVKFVWRDPDNRYLYPDPDSTIWYRFYEIGTNLPLFVGRDGVPKREIIQIEAERRNGYAWAGKWPAALLSDAKRNGLLC